MSPQESHSSPSLEGKPAKNPHVSDEPSLASKEESSAFEADQAPAQASQANEAPHVKGQPETSAQEGLEDSKQAPQEIESEEDKLQMELQEAREQALRLAAEIQNQSRRHESLLVKERNYATAQAFKDLLHVVDNFESSMKHAPQELASESLKAWKEGIELTMKSLIDTLKKHGVDPIYPLGESFDPTYHEAVAMAPGGDEVPDNQVIEVFQTGYLLRDRVLRPARVVVKKNQT